MTIAALVVWMKGSHTASSTPKNGSGSNGNNGNGSASSTKLSIALQKFDEAHMKNQESSDRLIGTIREVREESIQCADLAKAVLECDCAPAREKQK